MKKRLAIPSLALLPLLLVSCTGLSAEDYMHDIAMEREDFRILQLTDIHWSLSTNIPRQKDYMDILVEHSDPDLIVITGDALFTATKNIATMLYDYIDSLKNSDLTLKFRMKYRGVDVLMMDDVQFLSGKTGSQESLFHTFNDLYQFRKQIILTSDRHPRELASLEERLKSRFQSGLTIDVTKPNIETRIAILQKKAYMKKYDVSQKAIFFIAENITSNIRELDGALNKVVYFCSLSGRSTDDLDAVKEALKDDIDISTHVLSMDSITDAVCAYYGVKKADIVGKRKNKLIR